MIQANELRLGNYVNINDGSEHDKIRQISGIEHKIVYTLIKGCRFAQVHQNFDRIYPIPLTEEIIIKCGFEKEVLDDGDYYYSLNLFRGGYNNISFLYGQSEAYLFPYEDVTFKYLHQLQNAYHSITGKELEVNL